MTRLNNQRGVAMILVAFALPALLGIAALAIDVGYMYAEKAQVQTTADAASLAGAMELPDQPQAQSVASQYVAFNGGGQVTISFPYPDEIKVDITRNIGLFFARLGGHNDIDITATATARRGQFGLLSGADININQNIIGYGPPAFMDGDIHGNGDVVLNMPPVLERSEITASGTVSPGSAGTSGVGPISIEPIDMAWYRSQAVKIYNENSNPDYPAGILYDRQGNHLFFNLDGNWGGDIYYAEGNIVAPSVSGSASAENVTLVVDNDVEAGNLYCPLDAGDDFNVFIISSRDITVLSSVDTLSGIVFRAGGSFSCYTTTDGFVPDKMRVVADSNINIDVMWTTNTNLDFHDLSQPPFAYMMSWSNLVN